MSRPVRRPRHTWHHFRHDEFADAREVGDRREGVVSSFGWNGPQKTTRPGSVGVSRYRSMASRKYPFRIVTTRSSGKSYLSLTSRRICSKTTITQLVSSMPPSNDGRPTNRGPQWRVTGERRREREIVHTEGVPSAARERPYTARGSVRTGRSYSDALLPLCLVRDGESPDRLTEDILSIQADPPDPDRT